MREIMTPEQAAEYFELTTDAVYRPIRQKKLAAAQVGRTYRIAREHLEAFLVANSASPKLRPAIFKRALELAERNPGVDSDAVLEELEAWDEERKALGSNARRR